jgi:hypothetical protein
MNALSAGSRDTSGVLLLLIVLLNDAALSLGISALGTSLTRGQVTARR